jgi:carbon storage regulator
MLVFTRRRGETIMIGDGIRIEVLRVGRNGVRLGVVAPADVVVHRKEIYDEIRLANQKAAEGPRDLDEVARRLRRHA